MSPLDVATVLAGASTTVQLNPGVIASVLQFGFFGAVFVDVVGTHKFLVPAWSTKRDDESHVKELDLKDQLITSLKTDLTEVKAANSELQRLTSEKMIPALVQATEVSRAYVSELAKRQDRRDRGDEHGQVGTGQ